MVASSPTDLIYSHIGQDSLATRLIFERRRIAGAATKGMRRESEATILSSFHWPYWSSWNPPQRHIGFQKPIADAEPRVRGGQVLYFVVCLLPCKRAEVVTDVRRVAAASEQDI